MHIYYHCFSEGQGSQRRVWTSLLGAAAHLSGFLFTVLLRIFLGSSWALIHSSAGVPGEDLTLRDGLGKRHCSTVLFSLGKSMGLPEMPDAPGCIRGHQAAQVQSQEGRQGHELGPP